MSGYKIKKAHTGTDSYFYACKCIGISGALGNSMFSSTGTWIVILDYSQNRMWMKLRSTHVLFSSSPLFHTFSKEKLNLR